MVIRDSVADDIVKRCAHAFGETFVMERSGDAAVFCGKVIDQTVNLGRAHSLADVGSDVVEYSGIKRRAPFDGFDLTGGLK